MVWQFLPFLFVDGEELSKTARSPFSVGQHRLLCELWMGVEEQLTKHSLLHDVPNGLIY
jgi:hypothetical protein